MNDEESTLKSSASFVDSIEPQRRPTETWRMKERMKTVSVALTLCLNIGVDPPDVVKPQQCSRLECWLDPMAVSQQKALEMIGAALQKQYERWQPRARYKLSLDPTVDDVKKLCTSLRRNAKEERVLFHYNGHGVPKATKNGEIWVFNERYTQYIPLSIYDLQTWMGTPSIFVWDCNCAGVIVESFRQFAEQHEREMLAAIEFQQKSGNITQNGGASTNEQALLKNTTIDGSVCNGQRNQQNGETSTEDPSVNVGNTGVTPPNVSGTAIPNFRDCIQLGACQVDQILPMNPELPADLFTSCLTTPIKVAVLWHILQNNLTDKLPLDIIDKIPGQLSDRRTLLGELNWILTAITDTIAWNTLPRDLFQTLFRQDLLVASLFRNFLLADRVLRSYHCTPVSSPELPSAANHPMWQSWDLVLDVCLSQLPTYLPRPDATGPPVQPVPSIPLSQSSTGLSDMGGCEYTHSTFFASQLTAFEVWLEYGYDHREPPQQLPIVLQVLLSQVHRVRALELLGRFLDLGPWAVSLALSVGIFPYVLKLLQSFTKELRPLLSFIWAKILAFDPACKGDLIKDGGHRYFLQILSDPSVSCEQKTVAAFVLACISDDYAPGQEAIMQGGFMSICVDLLNDCRSSLLRQWLAIGLGRLWADFDAARWQCIRCMAYEKLYELLDDPVAEVRASAVYALGTLISNPSDKDEHATHTDHSIAMTLIGKIRDDPSAWVRKELIVALHWVVLNFEGQFVTIAYEIYEGRIRSNLDEYKQQRRGNSRQPSLTVADNVSLDSLIGTGSDIPRRDSMQNIHASSPTGSVTAKTNLTPVSSFSKLINAISSSPTASTPRSTTNHHEMSILESQLRNFSFRGTDLLSNVYTTVWRAILTLATDPHPEVASLAERVVMRISNSVLDLRRKSESEQSVKEKKTLDGMQRQTTASMSPSTNVRHPAPLNVVTKTHAMDEVDCHIKNPLHALQRPKFVIGSPSDLGAAHVNSRKLSPLNTSSPSTAENTPAMNVYSTIYPTVRRPMFGSGPCTIQEQKLSSPRRAGRKSALIKTEFITWSTARFIRPILHLLSDEAGRDDRISESSD